MQQQCRQNREDLRLAFPPGFAHRLAVLLQFVTFFTRIFIQAAEARRGSKACFTAYIVYPTHLGCFFKDVAIYEAALQRRKLDNYNLGSPRHG